MTGLETLPPQSRAVLALVLVQGKSFDEIGGLLRIEPQHIRARAHAAALQIVPPPEALGRNRRAAITDYLLGQDSVSARVQVRARLREGGPERDWARALSEALSPQARVPLPAIPELADERPGGTSKHPRRRRRWLLFGTLTMLCVIAAAAVVVLASETGKSAHPRMTARAPTRSAATRRAPTRNSVQTIRRLTFAPTSADPNALGAGAVVRHGGSLSLLLQARGLAANHGDSYGVWLFNTPIDARLLGFVSPPVGSAGTFSSGVSLPDDAIRFRSLIVTREKSTRPASPGPMVLHASLSLS